MFSKDQELEKRTDFSAEEIGELSDEQLVAVVGGANPHDPIDMHSSCIYCCSDQPSEWTSNYCWYCGAPFPTLS